MWHYAKVICRLTELLTSIWALMPLQAFAHLMCPIPKGRCLSRSQRYIFGQHERCELLIVI